jgi:hypothetical protein
MAIIYTQIWIFGTQNIPSGNPDVGCNRKIRKKGGKTEQAVLDLILIR